MDIKVQYVGTKFYDCLHANREVYAYAITTPKGKMEGNILSYTKNITPYDVLPQLIQAVKWGDNFILDGLKSIFAENELDELLGGIL